MALMTLAFVLSGCAAGPTTEPESITTSEPQISESAEVATDLDFETVAISSCDRALAQGVEEITIGESYRQVLVPKEQSLDGYSAAWEDMETGETGLIWEADAFLSCAAAITIGLAADAGEEPNWSITATNEGFELFQDFGEFGTQTIGFKVEDGNFIAAEIADGEAFEIRYGSDIEASLELIGRAVEEFGG